LLYNPNNAVSYIDNTYPTSTGQVFGDIYFRQNVAGTMTTRMSIKADGGSVGIGTTSSPTMLQVVGTGVASVGTINIKGSQAHLGLTTAAGTFKGWYGYYNSATHGSDLDLNIKTGYAGGSNIRLSANGDTTAAQLFISGSGNVGVGTTGPSTKLHVYEAGASDVIARLTPANVSYDALLQMTGQGNNMSAEGFEIWYSNTIGDVHLSTTYADDAASIHFHTRTGASKSTSNERLTILGGGNVGIGTTAPAYKLEVNGSFAASTKSFKIDHPTKPGKKLVYGSLESPYHGVRLTGKDTLVGGKCVVNLPDYICKLVMSDSVNIQITPIKCGKVIYVDEISVENNYFTVKYDKSMLESYKNYEFFWDFTATRCDVPELQVET